MTGRYLVNFDLKELPIYRSDLLIIGGGIAGITSALIAADEVDTIIITKGQIRQSSTWHAQGGIAAAMGDDDSSELHLKDTLTVGGYLSNKEAVRILVEEAREAIEFLVALGMNFDHVEGKLRLAREGGHSRARVLHAGDGTGSVIAATLGRAASAKERLDLKQNRVVIDLLTTDQGCVGALVYNVDDSVYEAYLSPQTMLATGGMGQLYFSTTNPLMATGDGFAMAARAGAELESMEFIQFHPTAFNSVDNPRFLISEALRGEGAYLLDAAGNRFMVGLHSLAELAPRDVVSHEMIETMSRDGRNFVYLDARHIGGERIRSRFPGIYKYLKEHDYDLAEDLVPVAPAAHYMIGGIKTDLVGRSTIPGLLASGEVASTGVHGANRLASNSLLEGLVFSKRSTEHFLSHRPAGINGFPDIHFAGLPDPEAGTLIETRERLRLLMEEKVAILRSSDGLAQARAEVGAWLRDLQDRSFATPQAWEVQNMIQLASLIINAALARKESVGVHFRVG